MRLMAVGQHHAVSVEDVASALKELRLRGLVLEKSTLWQSSTSSSDLPQLRKKRARLSAMKLLELQPFLTFAQNIPWISGVAVTGSVSVDNADAKDDVDLMILTQANRLWLVRPLLVLFSVIKGKRRSWNKEEYNSWCLNLWLEETSLSVMPDKRSVYTAYEVCQARWLLTKANIEQRFLLANAWAGSYVPHYFETRLAEADHYSDNSGRWLLFAFLLDGINTAAYTLQRWYMQRHMTTERVGHSYAFFHPRDTKKTVVSRWKAELAQLL